MTLLGLQDILEEKIRILVLLNTTNRSFRIDIQRCDEENLFFPFRKKIYKPSTFFYILICSSSPILELERIIKKYQFNERCKKIGGRNLKSLKLNLLFLHQFYPLTGFYFKVVEEDVTTS